MCFLCLLFFGGGGGGVNMMGLAFRATAPE